MHDSSVIETNLIAEYLHWSEYKNEEVTVRITPYNEYITEDNLVTSRINK